MRMLFPPLREGEVDGVCCDDDASASASSSALSADLRANFDAMRALACAERRLDQQLDNESTSNDTNGGNGQHRGTPGKASKKRSLSESNGALGDEGCLTQRRELHKRKFDLAVATAISVEGEISRLANGIAELEALLRSQEDDHNENGSDALLPDAAFPFLPLVVPPDDEYDHHTKVFVDSGKEPNQDGPAPLLPSESQERKH
uniref:Uncharacterized protein n=1 Tax=Ditylum brightwellii TaxID=49249 RepID=A0A6V2NIK5_9STRA|mmetsp:Transcript_25149/g.33346  ORF Transcript_25149/g.33346 Transcript_25149/m.33346 type:complete len:204 (+) Transcript_25149:651-1262(+)